MAFWLALAVLLLSIVVGVVYVVLRGLAFWRLAKKTGDTFTRELDRISSVTAQIDGKIAEANAAAARLQEAGDRLSMSRAQLDVQLAALREARAQVRRVFWFVPGV